MQKIDVNRLWLVGNKIVLDLEPEIKSKWINVRTLWELDKDIDSNLYNFYTIVHCTIPVDAREILDKSHTKNICSKLAGMISMLLRICYNVMQYNKSIPSGSSQRYANLKHNLADIKKCLTLLEPLFIFYQHFKNA